MGRFCPTGHVRSRLFFQYTATREHDLDEYADGQVGGFLDVYMLPLLRYRLRQHPDAARDKYLTFRVGYAYSFKPANGAKPSQTTQIPRIDATGRFHLPWDIFLTDRNRGDLRFVNGVFSPKYRNRLKLDREFQVGNFRLTPYADVEVFYDSRYHEFDEFRYEAGVEWLVARFLSLEAYYTRQRDTKSSPEFVNALGVKLEFYLRNRPK